MNAEKQRLPLGMRRDGNSQNVTVEFRNLRWRQERTELTTQKEKSVMCWASMRAALKSPITRGFETCSYFICSYVRIVLLIPRFSACSNGMILLEAPEHMWLSASVPSSPSLAHGAGVSLWKRLFQHPRSESSGPSHFCLS